MGGLPLFSNSLSAENNRRGRSGYVSTLSCNEGLVKEQKVKTKMAARGPPASTVPCFTVNKRALSRTCALGSPQSQQHNCTVQVYTEYACTVGEGRCPGRALILSMPCSTNQGYGVQAPPHLKPATNRFTITMVKKLSILKKGHIISTESL